MSDPHLRFLIALVLVGPVLAITGVSSGGRLAPAGVGLGGLVVAVAAWGSWRGPHPGWAPFRLRMRAVALLVLVAAGALVLGSIVVLVTG